MTAEFHQRPQKAPGLIELLVEAIYSEPRSGRPMPARVELGPDLFLEFQRSHRQALAAVLPDVVDVYPGSLVGVPVVQKSEPGAAILRIDGRRGILILS
ncbi:hypothetical protein [Acidovorax sp. Leaf84]|uniref:hypothetical protein n=1 Tax=Acidovorax sp. Leaf84 TaxID=1736240 RepID=UPI0012E13A32|nr:hypothetical protein [Acidovorax sp. Leaf84]